MLPLRPKYLLAHDASTKRYLDYTKIAKIIIKDHAFIGARALIMPGVTVGENAIIAAGSVVTKSVPDGCVAGGNPAKIIAKTEDYINKHQKIMAQSKVYDQSWTVGGNMTVGRGKTMSKELGASIGYVK